MVDRGATDLLVDADRPASVRIFGALVRVDDVCPSADDMRRMIENLLSPDQQQDFTRNQDFDLSFEVERLARFRCSLYRQRGTLCLAVRALPLVIPSLDSLGLPPVVSDLAMLPLAETGQLTLATLHTNSAAKTINRIIDAFPGERQPEVRSQLALSLEAVISQTLLPRINGGLVAAAEVLIATGAVKTMIREGRLHQIYATMQASQNIGMRTMNQTLADLVMRNAVSVEEACDRSSDVKELRLLIHR